MKHTTRALLFGAACAVFPARAAAQTDDPVFGRWRANPLTIGTRAAGMGGAFVAIADDARAAFVNPAGLAQIPMTEISVSSGRPWAAVAGSRWRFGLAAYYTRGEQEELPEPDGDSLPLLQPAVWEAGVAAGFQLTRRVRLGVGVAYRDLRVEQESGDTPHPLAGRSDDEVRMTVGTLVDLIPASVVGSSPLKLGVSVQPGVSWEVPREQGEPVELRRPGVGSLGLAWRATNSWSFSGQVDFIRYQEVVDALRRNVGDEKGADFDMSNAAEPRLGVEYATPLRCGCGSVKVRTGVGYVSPGTLRFVGEDPLLRGAFRARSWRTTVTLGASLFAEHFSNALRIDVDSRDLIEGPALSVGVVWRF